VTDGPKPPPGKRAGPRAATRDRGKWKPGQRLVIDLRGAEPVPKGSMSGFTPGWKPGQFQRPIVVVTDSKKGQLRAHEHEVRQIATREMDKLGLPCAQEQPFELLLVYYLPRPNGDYNAAGELKPGARIEPWTKPDLSKLTRATEDALTGMVWDDDSRIVRTVTEKRYATRERDVGVWIEVRVRPATMRELAEFQQPMLPAVAG